jgi:hypothetical protein
MKKVSLILNVVLRSLAGSKWHFSLRIIMIKTETNTQFNSSTGLELITARPDSN